MRYRAPSTAPGERIYAIGDIHGRHDLMTGMLERIRVDHTRRPAARRVRVIVLGDVINRGPDSRRVIAALRAFQQHGARLRVLMGNHEWMLLHALMGNAEAQREWLRFGGAQCLESFGIAPPDADEDRWRFAERLAGGLGEAVIDWLRALPFSDRSGDFFFCHAGVEPGIALARQSDEALVTVRGRFMDSRADHGAVIVHGHNRVDTIEICANRISLDTCGYDSGTLSAIGLEGTKMWPLQYHG